MSEKPIRELSLYEKQVIAAKYAYVAGLIEYDGATDDDLLTQRRELKAEFEQLILEVRAVALREVQAIFERSRPAQWDAGMVSCVIGARAAKFEQEAMN